MDIINALIQKGWYLEISDTFHKKHTDTYRIIPNDERKDWCTEYTTIEYGYINN